MKPSTKPGPLPPARAEKPSEPEGFAERQLAYDRERVARMQQKADDDGLPPIVDAAEFLAGKITPPRELVSGILHQGSKMVLGGGSKTFKTWTLLDLAVSVAAGKPWLGFGSAKGRVLFCNFEIQPSFFQERLSAVAETKGVALAPGMIDLWNLRGHAASYDELLPRIGERAGGSGYALVILDPIYKLYGKTDENSAGEVARLLNAVEVLTLETGATVAFGAHYSKGNQAGKEAIDRISGSGVFARDPDTILNFTRHQEENAFTVEATLRNFKPIQPFCVRWDYPLMRRDDELDPAKLKKSKGGRAAEYTVAMLVECLGERKLTTSELQKLCAKDKRLARMSPATFKRILHQAKELNAMAKDEDNRWKAEGSNGSEGSKPSSEPSKPTQRIKRLISL